MANLRNAHKDRWCFGLNCSAALASGDFDLDSDVDFLVVTNGELTETNIKNLQEIQRKIHRIDCYPARHLEGSYISIKCLNDWNTVGEKKLYYFAINCSFAIKFTQRTIPFYLSVV